MNYIKTWMNFNPQDVEEDSVPQGINLEYSNIKPKSKLDSKGEYNSDIISEQYKSNEKNEQDKQGAQQNLDQIRPTTNVWGPVQQQNPPAQKGGFLEKFKNKKDNNSNTQQQQQAQYQDLLDIQDDNQNQNRANNSGEIQKKQNFLNKFKNKNQDQKLFEENPYDLIPLDQLCEGSEPEKLLTEKIIYSGGVRLQQSEEMLAEFVQNAEKMNVQRLSSHIVYKLLENCQYQEKCRTIYAAQELCKKLQKYKDFFKVNIQILKQLQVPVEDHNDIIEQEMAIFLEIIQQDKLEPSKINRKPSSKVDTNLVYTQKSDLLELFSTSQNLEEKPIALADESHLISYQQKSSQEPFPFLQGIKKNSISQSQSCFKQSQDLTDSFKPQESSSQNQQPQQQQQQLSDNIDLMKLYQGPSPNSDQKLNVIEQQKKMEKQQILNKLDFYAQDFQLEKEQPKPEQKKKIDDAFDFVSF